MLMMLRAVMKESSNETRTHKNKSSSKMRIVGRPRQGSAVTRYSLSWKRGHIVYLIYWCPLQMVLVANVSIIKSMVLGQYFVDGLQSLPEWGAR